MKKILSVLLTLAMTISLLPANILAAEKPSFSDIDGSEYYAESAELLSAIGIIAGYEDGTYGADRTITRAEMAVIVCKLLGKASDADHAKGETKFDDVPSDYWASGFINIASESEIISGYGDGNFGPENDVKYEEAITMLVHALGHGDEIEVDSEDWSKGYIDFADNKGITVNLKGKKGEAATRGDIAVMSVNSLKIDLYAPVASVAAGKYTATQKVELITKTEDAEIYYTTNGDTPTTQSTKYTGAISITKTTALKAVTVKNNLLVSDVMTAEYTIAGNPIIGGGGGNSSSSTISTHTISFDLNYDNATDTPETQSIKSGNTATEPTTPVRDGYIFLGWTTEKDKGVIFDFSAGVTASLTLYALWSKTTPDNTYKVTFMLNDGSENVHAVQYVTSGSKASVPTEPTRDLYEFTGWYTEAEAINFYDFYSPVTENIIIYAGWNATSADSDLYASQSETETVYSISAMEMKNDVVYTTINTNSQAVIVLKFLDEDTNEVISVASTSTPTYGELLSVGIPVNCDLPDYFIITADLYDINSQRLCDTYTCIYYTSAYEKFDQQTVNDFVADRVINFDGSETNNFGVLNESVIRISCSDTVNVLSVEKNEITDGDVVTTERTYTFENPDTAITTLNSGDKIYINSTDYLFKINTISNTDGKIVMTESTDTNICEFYDVLKVNMPSQNTAPSRTRGRDIETYSFPYSVQPPSITIPSEHLDFTINGTINGTVKTAFAYDVENLSDSYLYCMVINDMTVTKSIDVIAKAGISNDDKLKKPEQKVELPKLSVATGIPGLFVRIKPAVIYGVEVSAKLHAEYKSNTKTGFAFSTLDNKVQKIEQKTNNMTFDTEGAISLKVGVAARLAVEFLTGAISTGVTGEFGIGADGKVKAGVFDDNDSKHACMVCVDGYTKYYTTAYASLDYELDEDLKGTLLKFDIINKEFPFKPSQFYISISNDEASIYNGKVKFDWGECQNITYKTTVIAKDYNGNEVPTAEIFITKNDGMLSVSDYSPFTTYLYPGTYTATANIDSKDVQKTFTVTDKAQEIELVAEKENGKGFLALNIIDAITKEEIKEFSVICHKKGNETPINKSFNLTVMDTWSEEIPADQVEIIYAKDGTELGMSIYGLAFCRLHGYPMFEIEEGIYDVTVNANGYCGYKTEIFVEDGHVVDLQTKLETA